ncbi:MAG: hypothetical protein V3V30_10150 [Parvularculaceae bacterium]
MALAERNKEEINMDAALAFESLKALLGNWQVQHDHGRISRVHYKMSCHDTVMLETWALKPDLESLTIYHMDGADFIATHYCPLGNQPRLLFTKHEDGKLKFETQSITNLISPDHDHCRAFDFEIIDKDTIKRRETYAENGVATQESGVFTRH